MSGKLGGRMCVTCGKPGGTAIARAGYAHGGKCARTALDRLSATGKGPEYWAELEAYAESLFRSRTPARDVMDADPVNRVLFSDLLARFPDLHAVDREWTVPIMRRVFRRMRREFPGEGWRK